jgi:hypothetical protein
MSSAHPHHHSNDHESSKSKHHVIVGGAYPNAAIHTTIVGALSDDGTLREYWWDVTPDRVPISKMNDPDDVRTILWTLYGRKIDGSGGLPRLKFDHAAGGVRITDPKWESDWPQPARQGNVYVMALHGHPNVGTYSYSIYFKVNGRSHRIDPELELGED